MIVVAFFFDLVQLMPKLFIVLGFAVTVVPIVGWVVGGIGIAVGEVLDLVFGLLVSLMGFGTLWIWFLCKDVQVLGGTYMERKVLMFPAFFMLEFFVSSLPSITVWTWITIHLTRKEDKEAHAKLVARLKKAHEFLKRREAQREAELAELTARVAQNTVSQQLRAANDNIPNAANDNISFERRRAA